MRKNQLRLTESQLHSVIKEAVLRALNESGMPTYTQIRNITGIQDDDELNASVEAEQHEQMESDVWRALTELANGQNPRRYSYNFHAICDMLASKFGLKYTGPDENNETHNFSNGKVELAIAPNMFYTRQGTLSVENVLVSGI